MVHMVAVAAPGGGMRFYPLVAVADIAVYSFNRIYYSRVVRSSVTNLVP